MIYEGNSVIVPTNKPFIKRVYRFIYGTSVNRIAKTLNIPENKVVEDIQNGYLRIFDDAPDIVFKDWFYKQYLKYKGDTSKLKKFGYKVPIDKKHLYYNYFIKRENKGNGQFCYNLYAPNGEVHQFCSKDRDEAFAKAKTYAFENQEFGDAFPKHLTASVIFTIDELFYLLNFLPEKYYFTRLKIYLALTILKNKKHQDLIILNKNEGKNGF